MKTNRNITFASLIACVVSVTPAIALGAGWTTTDRSVVAMGTGGAGAARADDPAANVYNPAAGLMSPGLAASLGVVLAAPNLSAEGPGINSSIDGSLSTPPHVHARWTGERVSFGASLIVPFGSKVTWPEDWPGRFELIEARLQVLRASAFVGMRFDRVSVAVGPFLDIGSLKFQRAIDFIEEEGQTTIDTRANGAGLSAAVFARLTDELDVGLSYSSRSKLAFDGYADFTVPPEFSVRAADQAIKSDVLLPDRFVLGGLWRINGDVEVLADLELVLWSTVKELHLDFASEETPDLIKPREWKTTVTTRIGVAWQALPFLKVRGGAYYDPSPVPVETVGPSSPDSSRLGLSLGAGLSVVDGVSVDLGYQLVGFLGQESQEAALPGVDYSGTAHLLGAALSGHM